MGRSSKSRSPASVPPALVVAEEYSSSAEPVVQYLHSGATLERQLCTENSGQQRLQAGVREAFLSVFMPQGYPGSVSADYLDYQIWDSLQAFCSYTTNTIATKATLEGMGVGNEAANAATALVTWILKDGAGMLGRIGFAWAQGNDLDNNAKLWRLVADGADDCARIILLLAPR